jgi:membrane-bound metal-dependent hydrolase YbcI (DUF457 family)
MSKWLFIPFTLNIDGKSDKGLGFFAVILELFLEFFLYKVICIPIYYGLNKPFKFTPEFLGYKDIIIFISFLIPIISCAAFASKRYEISSQKVFTGTVFWPWILIRFPKLIKENEINRKLRIIKEVMDA